ncbi:unnamed protein product [Nezara viridula]|uniref:Uncharacterized protein n=1 Tax=Nezara viridula TaxID=85310 RepID=A0A9P0HGZ6_NEZVI|nr:unnamed protein product [Nezara viridula]
MLAKLSLPPLPSPPPQLSSRISPVGGERSRVKLSKEFRSVLLNSFLTEINNCYESQRGRVEWMQHSRPRRKEWSGRDPGAADH